MKVSYFLVNEDFLVGLQRLESALGSSDCKCGLKDCFGLFMFVV